MNGRANGNGRAHDRGLSLDGLDGPQPSSAPCPPSDKEKSAGWFPVPNALVDWIPHLSSVEFAVVVVLLKHQNMSAGVACLALGTLARLLGHKQHSTVTRALKRLKARGFIQTIQEGGGRHADTTRRRIKIPPPPSAESAPCAKSAPCAEYATPDGAKSAPSPTPNRHHQMAPIGPQVRLSELDLLNKTSAAKTRGKTAAAGFSKKEGRTEEQEIAYLEMLGLGIENPTPDVLLAELPDLSREIICRIANSLSDNAGAGLLVNKIRELAPG